jgi:hypothetical protein
VASPRQLVSLFTPGFDPRLSLVGYVVDKMTLREFLISNFCCVLSVVCFLLGNSPASEFYTYPPMKLERTECSETSAYKILTPRNYSEESVQQKTLRHVFLQVLCFALSLPFDHCSMLIHVSVTNASNLSSLQHRRITHLGEKNVLDISYSYP